LITAPKNLLLERDKNITVRTVKIVPVRRVYQDKVKPPKPVPIAFARIMLRKVAMPLKVNMQTATVSRRMPVSETVAVQLLVALDAVNKRNK
jgi:hypothetical protein